MALSRVVSEVFNVEKFAKVVPFNRLDMHPISVL